jgi:glutamate synthase domain-containing protein 1
MCGIVGLYLKNPALESQLGELFTPMLIAMTDRGPDSAGFAIYGDEVPGGWVKLTLRHPDESYDWEGLSSAIKDQKGVEVEWFQNSSVAIFKIHMSDAEAEAFVGEYAPEVLILSAGQSIEILKEVGLPEKIAETFNLKGMKGSHIIGHTRMATESAVTMEGSHPFSTGMDLCLVHNGSLSNHNRLRKELIREGVTFETENDSEVAAGYLTYRLQQGDTLKEALENALKDLDGFFTFTIGTRDGFAVVRDPIACKPAVMAETDDYVAIASEYQALTTLPGIKNARVWEPEPETIYIWERNSDLSTGAQSSVEETA